MKWHITRFLDNYRLIEVSQMFYKYTHADCLTEDSYQNIEILHKYLVFITLRNWTNEVNYNYNEEFYR